MKPIHHTWLGSIMLAAVSSLQAAQITVTSDITANTTWTADNVYILDKSIFVKSGATLTIQPGTTVLGTQNIGNNTYGSLVVARGSKLMAEGTAEAPIVFTAKEEYDADLTVDPSDDLDPAAGDGGYWGGVILLGSAPINFYTGPTTNANENTIEGFPAGSSTDLLYGGNNPADNSGVLKYVSIRFGGYVYAANREINGLTMGGVGSGTTIENVEVISNTDDGVEIFGGTVNTKRIAVAFCQDDSFDLDEGHQGYHQFWFAIQNASGTLGDRGGEWDGGNGSTVQGTPYTTAMIYNATFIGDSATAGGGNHAFFVDDNYAGQLHNSVVHQFSGEAVRDSGDGIGTAPNPLFQNITWGTIAGGAGSLASVSGTGNSPLNTNPDLVGISRTPNGGLDPRPNLASPLRTSALSAAPVGAPAGFFETVSYRGAFGDTNWLNGWSYLSQAGYLSGYPDAGGSTGGSFADADGDGISDAVESANTALGFNPAVNDAAAVLGSLYTSAQYSANFTAGQTSVTGNPNAFNLYETADILDLRTTAGVTVQKVGDNVTLSVPVEKSDTLGGWVPAGNMTLGPFSATAGKEFYRLEVQGAE
jgi:hypothetical protein